MEIFQTLTLGSVILVRIWVGRISTKVDAATEQLRQLTDPESGIPVRLARLEGELQQISSQLATFNATMVQRPVTGANGGSIVVDDRPHDPHLLFPEVFLQEGPAKRTRSAAS